MGNHLHRGSEFERAKAVYYSSVVGQCGSIARGINELYGVNVSVRDAAEADLVVHEGFEVPQLWLAIKGPTRDAVDNAERHARSLFDNFIIKHQLSEQHRHDYRGINGCNWAPCTATSWVAAPFYRQPYAPQFYQPAPAWHGNVQHNTQSMQHMLATLAASLGDGSVTFTPMEGGGVRVKVQTCIQGVANGSPQVRVHSPHASYVQHAPGSGSHR